MAIGCAHRIHGGCEFTLLIELQDTRFPMIVAARTPDFGHRVELGEPAQTFTLPRPLTCLEGDFVAVV
jgi:hypothetical protein